MTNTIAPVKRIQTGIPGFDQLIYGGLPSGRAYLVSGEPGTGKTIFSLQFLLSGLKKGESCVFISIDEKPDHIIADCEALGWDIQSYLNSGILNILDITELFRGNKSSTGDKIEINKIVNRIITYIKEINPSRVVIDPIAPLIFSDKNIQDVIEYIRSTIFQLESIPNCTTLLTSYIPVGSTKLSCFGIEEFAASGIIHLRLVTLNNKRIRTIGVRKMRSTRIDLSEYSFEILPERGLVLRQPI
jgi:circadian clock protein KaiC